MGLNHFLRIPIIKGRFVSENIIVLVRSSNLDAKSTFEFFKFYWHFLYQFIIFSEYLGCRITVCALRILILYFLKVHNFFRKSQVCVLFNQSGWRQYTQGYLTPIFPTLSNRILNLDFQMKTGPGMLWLSNDRQNSVELCPLFGEFATMHPFPQNGYFGLLK